MTTYKLVSASVLTVALLFGSAAARADHIDPYDIADCQALIVGPVYDLETDTNNTWYGGRNNRDGENAIRATLLSKLDDADSKLGQAKALLMKKPAGAETKNMDALGKMQNYQDKVNSLVSDGPKMNIEYDDQTRLGERAQDVIDCVTGLLHEE
jgi:hypothetical protein